MSFSNTSVFDDAFGSGTAIAPDPFSVGYTPPPDWQAAIEQAAPGLTTVIEQQSSTPTQDWITTAARAVSLVSMADSQRRLINIQLDRAAKGLPPLDASQYSPGVQIRAGLSPELERGLMIGGAVLLLMYLMRRG